jgi:uncharacterized protein (DUF924 family)
MEGDVTATLDELLRFWFEEASYDDWFGAAPAFDAVVAERFGHLPEAAASGAYDAWRSSPRGALGLCLAFDQIPRNVHRGTPQAFAFDDKARAAAAEALERGHDQALPVEQRAFIYLPFEHSEALRDQDRSVQLFRALGDAEGLRFAQRHREIIARFGRFPHRNRVLGRDTTPEEEAFLQEPESSF